MKLDERAQEAVTSLRASVRQMTPRETSTSRRPRPWVLPAVAVATAVVLVAAIVTLAQRDETARVAAGVGDLPRLAPTYLPEGLELTHVDTVSADGHDARMSFHLYGNGVGDDPFAAADLAVVTVDEITAFDDGEPVEVRDRQGSYVDDGQAASADALMWTEDGFSVTLASRSLERDELVELAEVMRPTLGGPGFRRDDLPHGLDLVASRGQLSPTSGPVLGLGQGDSYDLEFTTPPPAPADSPRSLRLTVSTGDRSDLDVARWWFGQNASSIRLHDRPGVLAVGNVQVTRRRGPVRAAGGDDDDLPDPSVSPDVGSPSTSSVSLVWLEDKGVVVALSAQGLDEDEVVAIAESLAPMTPEEWSDLTVEPQPRSDGPDDAEVVAAGETRGGAWRIEKVSDPNTETGTRYMFCIDFDPQIPDGPVGACGGILAPEGSGDLSTSSSLSASRGRTLIQGTVTPDVARVVVALDDGERAEADLIAVDDQPFLVYVAGVPDERVSGEVIAFDDGGRELGRERILTHTSGGPPPPPDVEERSE